MGRRGRRPLQLVLNDRLQPVPDETAQKNNANRRANAVLPYNGFIKSFRDLRTAKGSPYKFLRSLEVVSSGTGG